MIHLILYDVQNVTIDASYVKIRQKCSLYITWEITYVEDMSGFAWMNFNLFFFCPHIHN